MQQGTSETRLFGADLAAELKQHVGRADQPILMKRIELDGATILKDIRSADERDVVKVNDVERLLKNRFQSRGLEDRSSCLMGGKRRKHSDRTLQRRTRHVGMVLTNCRRVPSV